MTRSAPKILVLLVCCGLARAEDPIEIGSRRELLVDDFVIESLQGRAVLRLHCPAPREVAIVHNKPWEGNICFYHTVFRDGDLYRMSMEGYYQGETCRIRRYTIRIDGFVSVRAPFSGGELVTKPLKFTGNKLTLNSSTSAAGGIRVEIQQPNGRPIPGFLLADCQEVFGDQLQRTVSWSGGSDLSKLEGQPVRLRFTLRDADLFSFQFVAN